MLLPPAAAGQQAEPALKPPSQVQHRGRDQQQLPGSLVQDSGYAAQLQQGPSAYPVVPSLQQAHAAGPFNGQGYAPVGSYSADSHQAVRSRY